MARRRVFSLGRCPPLPALGVYTMRSATPQRYFAGQSPRFPYSPLLCFRPTPLRTARHARNLCITPGPCALAPFLCPFLYVLVPPTPHPSLQALTMSLQSGPRSSRPSRAERSSSQFFFLLRFAGKGVCRGQAGLSRTPFRSYSLHLTASFPLLLPYTVTVLGPPLFSPPLMGLVSVPLERGLPTQSGNLATLARTFRHLRQRSVPPSQRFGLFFAGSQSQSFRAVAEFLFPLN